MSHRVPLKRDLKQTVKNFLTNGPDLKYTLCVVEREQQYESVAQLDRATAF